MRSTCTLHSTYTTLQNFSRRRKVDKDTGSGYDEPREHAAPVEAGLVVRVVDDQQVDGDWMMCMAPLRRDAKKMAVAVAAPQWLPSVASAVDRLTASIVNVRTSVTTNTFMRTQ